MAFAEAALQARLLHENEVDVVDHDEYAESDSEPG